MAGRFASNGAAPRLELERPREHFGSRRIDGGQGPGGSDFPGEPALRQPIDLVVPQAHERLYVPRIRSVRGQLGDAFTRREQEIEN